MSITYLAQLQASEFPIKLKESELRIWLLVDGSVWTYLHDSGWDRHILIYQYININYKKQF